MEIVGIVGHVKQWGLDRDDSEALHAQVYLSFMQLEDNGHETDGPPAWRWWYVLPVRRLVLFDALRHTSPQMSSEQVIYAPESMDELFPRRWPRGAFHDSAGYFCRPGIVAGQRGIYGVISYVVGERTREMGIRMALGAQRSDILWLILRQGGTLAGAGVVLGLVSSLGLARFMTGLLYGVRATDPVTFLAVASLLAWWRLRLAVSQRCGQRRSIPWWLCATNSPTIETSARRNPFWNGWCPFGLLESPHLAPCANETKQSQVFSHSRPVAKVWRSGCFSFQDGANLTT